MRITLRANSSGATHSQRGARRAARVNAPQSASAHTTQKLTTATHALDGFSPCANADACQAYDPSTSNSRSVLWNATTNGENG